mgnify:CR=1 FL=1
MKRLGFAEKWIQWIMTCVKTVKYSVRFNGNLLQSFTPTCGLRQGDPISPYLFLLCAEAFSAMLHHAEQSGKLKGIKVCNGAPSINHLLFADNSLLLMEANARNAQEVNRILNIYEACSGQVVNKEKSTILYTKNTRPWQKEEVRRCLHITTEGLSPK